MPYEAAHCGTPALLRDAQGSTQIDARTEDRGALLAFDAADGEDALARAMDRTSPLLSDPERVRRAAREKAKDGVTISEIVAEVLSRETSTKKRKKRRHACLLFAFAWAVCLAGVLAVMKVCMVGFMWVGIDFTAGMAHQRGAKKKWRARRNLSVGGDLDAERRGAMAGGSPGRLRRRIRRRRPRPASSSRADRGEGATGDVAAGAFARKKGGSTPGSPRGEDAPRGCDLSLPVAGWTRERTRRLVRQTALGEKISQKKPKATATIRFVVFFLFRRPRRRHTRARTRTSPLVARRSAVGLGLSRVVWKCSPRRRSRARPAAVWRGAIPR